MGASLVLFPAATFLVTAALLGYVLLQRTRSVFQPGIVAALVSILLWVGGMVVGRVGIDSSFATMVGVLAHFGGVCGVSAAFMVVAMRFARVSLLDHNAPAVVAGVAIPAVLCFALVASNSLHGAFGYALDGSFFRMSTQEWAGPLYPLLIAWVYLGTGAGLLLCVRRALQTGDPEERRRLVALSLTASTPLIGYAVHEAGWLPLPPEVPVATMCLTGTALIVVLGVTHYGFLDTSLMPLRDVIEHLDDGLVLADLEGTVAEVNATAAALFARPRAALVGTRLPDLLRELGDDGAARQALATPGATGLRARRLEPESGRILELSCGWVHGRRGAPIGCFAALADRTEQERHQHLRHRNQRLESLGVLLGGLAHEINNPLAYLRANLNHVAEVADQLEESVGEANPQTTAGLTELRDVVNESLEGLQKIGSVIASTAKLAPRDSFAAHSEVDVNELLEEALELATRYSGSSAAVVRVLSPDAPKLYGNAERLSQALVNLLVNAFQATPKSEGRVRICTRALDDEIHVLIEDNGGGVPPELRERIFDPFFSGREAGSGTGLGLSIAHDIVREHGGEIGLGASELGGECFQIRLPRLAEATEDGVRGC